MRSKFICCIFSVICCCCFGDICDHIRPILKKEQVSSLKNIDYIYMINLDQRPEKLQNTLSQLEPYGISPYRFSAVYGWDLNSEVKNNLGVILTRGMGCNQWAISFPHKLKGTSELEFLREDLYGNTVFCSWMTQGAIGCYLSHISVLQDAYDSGYQTVWIMEDDISVDQNPNVLSDYITKLDSLVGKEGWDILYTDNRTKEDGLFVKNIKEDSTLFWRPDMDLSDHKSFLERNSLNDDFMQIGSRMGTYSMLVRRSGMRKILDHVKAHRMFLPYDHEIAIIPNMRLYNIRSSPISFLEFASDNKESPFTQKEHWNKFKSEIIDEVHKITGWSNPRRTNKLLDFLYENKPKTCVEIGTFGGSTAFQIAKVLSFLNQGVLYSIDAWDPQEASKGLKKDSAIQWWHSINLENVKHGCQSMIVAKQLESYCKLIHLTSKKAVSLFSDETIDFLYIDGNDSAEGSLEDVTTYFPKVRVGGFICLNNLDKQEKNESIAFLMKHCIWNKEESLGISYLVFQKK
jgi:GR25 family glycosyltransferase involved in LPS biosynthesis